MSAPAERARYYSVAEGFNIARPPVPARTFLVERDAALEAASPTGLAATGQTHTRTMGFAYTEPERA